MEGIKMNTSLVMSNNGASSIGTSITLESNENIFNALYE